MSSSCWWWRIALSHELGVVVAQPSKFSVWRRGKGRGRSRSSGGGTRGRRAVGDWGRRGSRRRVLLGLLLLRRRRCYCCAIAPAADDLVDVKKKKVLPAAIGKLNEPLVGDISSSRGFSAGISDESAAARVLGWQGTLATGPQGKSRLPAIADANSKTVRQMVLFEIDEKLFAMQHGTFVKRKGKRKRKTWEAEIRGIIASSRDSINLAEVLRSFMATMIGFCAA